MAGVQAPGFSPVTQTVKIRITGEVIIHGDTPEQIEQALKEIPAAKLLEHMDPTWTTVEVISKEDTGPLRFWDHHIHARHYVAE